MSSFEYRDEDGDRLTITPLLGVPNVIFLTASPEGLAIPMDRVEEVVAGLRDMARQAGGQHVHRLGNPDDGGGILDDWDNCRDPECPGPTPTAVEQAAEERVTVYGIGINEWDRMHDSLRRIEAAVTPPSVAERQFLTFALDLAADRMASEDGFTTEDHAALDRFRAMTVGP